MTSEDIAKARSIIAGATPGPWPTIPTIYYRDKSPKGLGDVHGTGPNHVFDYKTEDKKQAKAKADQNFIAAARTGWPEALDHLEDKQEMLKDAYEMVRNLRAENELMQKGMHALNVGLAARNAENVLLKSVAEAAENMLPYLAEHGWQWDSELFQAIKAWRDGCGG